MILGRVMSGTGGEIILRVCRQILADEFPEISKALQVMLPDEKTRRVGQSIAAASLPALGKRAIPCFPKMPESSARILPSGQVLLK